MAPTDPSLGAMTSIPGAGLAQSAAKSGDDSFLSDLLLPEDLSADNFLRNVKHTSHLNQPMPTLAGIPLFRKLGEGGMGAVYYGVHQKLQREVAVKIMKLPEGNAEALARFQREARISSRIQDPHLVQVYDFNEAHGLHFLVLEFVRGGSAADVLKDATENKRPLAEHDALDLCIAATTGLCAAHRQGVVHRDIKPANILVPKGKDGAWRFGGAKLTDLGLARFEAAGQSLTLDAQSMGTPGYMSPEQAQDARRAAKPADVFSMGATLYALLTGKTPFTGSVSEILIKTMQTPHKPIVEFRSDISPFTRTLIDQCLAKDPAQRFPDAFALLDALKVCRTAAEDAPSQTKAAAEVSRLQRRSEVIEEEATREVGQIVKPPVAGNNQYIVKPPAAGINKYGVVKVAISALVILSGVVCFLTLNSRPDSKPAAITTAVTSSPAMTVSEKTTLEDLAKTLGAKLTEKGVRSLAVLEFLDESGGERQLGRKIGAAGKYFAEKIESVLPDVKGASYSLYERVRFAKVLDEIKFRTSNLLDTARLKELQTKIVPVDVVVFGVVRRSGRDVQVTLKALGIPDGAVLAQTIGTLALTTDMAALFGESYFQPPSAITGLVPPEKVLTAVAADKSPHPLSDPNCPYRVEIVEEGQLLPFYIHGTDWYVPADKGKKYTIRITNNSDEGVVVAVLIDGLNTIYQTREIPGQALKWALKPGKSIEIRGWQQPDNTTAREFVFTDADESLAARQLFRSEIGLITAVFYRATELKGLGTGTGETVHSNVSEKAIRHDNTAAASVNIRYDLRAVVEKLTRVEEAKQITK